MASDTLIERLRAGGIVHPRITVAEAQRAGLRLPIACAMLEKETGGGHNVFGHDPTIFVGAGKVTKAKYQEYKKRRVASGNRSMQGVGPCQLTWWEFQDEADREGGCWRPEINIRVGFRRLAANIKAHGEADGARRYNGTGKAAEAYSADLLRRAKLWEQRLAGALPATDGVPTHVPDGRQPVRRGDRGPVVAKMTRRLSRLHSPKTGKPYLDGPRRSLDAEAEAALKAFQADHRLVVDGIFGPRSQRRLVRALSLQKAKPTTQPAAQPATADGKPRVNLRTLVTRVQRADAETGQAWETLVRFMARRQRQLEHRHATALGREPALAAAINEGFAAVTAELKEIDGSLDALLATERAEQAVATAPPPAEPPPVEPPPTAGADGEATAAAMVVEAAPPAPPVNEGPAPPAPNAVPPVPLRPKRELTELSDAELLERIERLDRALDRARTVLIRRYIEVERDLGRLAPAKEESPATPVKPRRHRRLKTTLSPDQVKALQTALNAFTGKRLEGVGPVLVDGVKGPATIKRIRQAKHFLGYTGKARNSAVVDKEFMQRLRHPRSPRYSSPRMLARGLNRRRKQRKAAKLSSVPRAGVVTFDGRPVAAWIQPYLLWARNNGWKGTLNSGWRDPAHSEQLCLQMCGHTTCPGRCAGRTSNHAGSVKPAGAIDVSDYVTFGRLMARCPYTPRLQNQLGARDPVHFSISGR
jgi:peptidoglycan hydrolase-like protein with peptidoglycan-binding domain